ncbi:MAG: hypothetical protein ACI9BV_003794 [Rhodothermales bacterium]|jgi:hypothetical protein
MTVPTSVANALTVAKMTMSIRGLSGILLGVLLFPAFNGLQGQAIPGSGVAPPVSYFRFAESGDATVLIHVWGQVRQPGLYEVRRGIRFRDVLSMAGGPEFGMLESGTSRSIRVKHDRPGATGMTTLQEFEILNSLLPIQYDSLLEDGDMIMVDLHVRTKFSWRDGVTILTAAASVGLIVERLFSR